MGKLAMLLALALSMALGILGAVDTTWAKANDRAPCIGENASSFAPALRGDFGQVVVVPEARAGETGDVASGAAQSECN